VLLSATKQSLKAKLPELAEPVTVKDFIRQTKDTDALRMIACCFDTDARRVSIKEALEGFGGSKVTVLIGPEGDFSPEEARLAVQEGYQPVTLGTSRLRTETAAVTAAAATYFRYM